ncbi:ATPase, T2SS/T4P/T4SS family [Vibrio furnissii]|uniref:ATPase, T2SS/T4P/T4SS family n=1 Tax=Vibrio furnissii TaxID=29494 RepID=UPI003AA88C27
MYRVRLRCDGILIETQQPSHLSRRLSARIKIHQTRYCRAYAARRSNKVKLNQDTAIDIRVSTLPTLFGEKIVLHCSNSSASWISSTWVTVNAKAVVQMLCATTGDDFNDWPTGSSRQISLYTGLSILNKPEINISTAEDPVEINLCGINQVQVQPRLALVSPRHCALLRQDPM